MTTFYFPAEGHLLASLPPPAPLVCTSADQGKSQGESSKKPRVNAAAAELKNTFQPAAWGRCCRRVGPKLPPCVGRGFPFGCGRGAVLANSAQRPVRHGHWGSVFQSLGRRGRFCLQAIPSSRVTWHAPLWTPPAFSPTVPRPSGAPAASGPRLCASRGAPCWQPRAFSVEIQRHAAGHPHGRHVTLREGAPGNFCRATWK